MSSGRHSSDAGPGQPTEPVGQQPPAEPGSFGAAPSGGPQDAPPPQPPQPAYGQHGYGAGSGRELSGGPQYAQPQFALPYQPHAGYGPSSARPSPRPGIGGIVVALLGAIAGVIAFTATHWFSGKGDSSFSKIHDAIKQIDRVHAANALSVQYFSWLAWALLAVGVVTAVAGNLPGSASSVLRAISALVGLAGIVLTLFSVKFISDDAVAREVHAPHGLGGFLKDAAKAPSLYLALGAFLFVVIAALLGPRRSTS